MQSDVGRRTSGARERAANHAMTNVSIALEKEYFLESVGIAQLVMCGDVPPPAYSTVYNHTLEMKALIQWKTGLMLNTIQKPSV
jgi:hypothetical protein